MKLQSTKSLTANLTTLHHRMQEKCEALSDSASGRDWRDDPEYIALHNATVYTSKALQELERVK